MYNLELAISPAGQARLIFIAKVTKRSVENVAAAYIEDKAKEFFRNRNDDPTKEFRND